MDVWIINKHVSQFVCEFNKSTGGGTGWSESELICKQTGKKWVVEDRVEKIPNYCYSMSRDRIRVMEMGR